MTVRVGRRARGEEGAALVTAILVTLVLTGLLALAVSTSVHTTTSSTRDRNYDLALNAAEAGVDQAIARVQSSGLTFTGTISGSGLSGDHEVTVEFTPGRRYVIESTGTSGAYAAGTLRRRRIRVTLEPPALFDGALFSATDLVVKNGVEISGDVFANRSLTIEQNATVDGSLTSALSWIDVGKNATITGDVQSGSFHPLELFAIRLDTGAEVGGDATASTTTGCPSADPTISYAVDMAASAVVGGTLTTLGERVGGGSVGGYRPFTCTVAPMPVDMPDFTYSSYNYDPTTLHEFTGLGAVASFNAYRAANGNDLRGTFYVQDAAPSQTNRIDLDRAVITGDTDIITNAPVFTNGVSDTSGAPRRFVVVSTYQPPAGSECTENDDSECALHIKNNFDASCTTTVLLYASPGPAAVKNNLDYCGSIYAENLFLKNEAHASYNATMQRVAGFGDGYVRSRFEELPPN